MRHEAARDRTRTRVPRRGLVERKLRLWSGLLIAAYVVLHLANHALGLISIEAMERAREWMQAVWGTPVMLFLLYGSLVVHFGLALSVLYRRSTLRMPVWEAAQIVLGLLVVPLIAGHATGTRGSRELLGIDVDYPLVLGRHLDRRLPPGAPDGAAARRLAARGRRFALLASPQVVVRQGPSFPLCGRRCCCLSCPCSVSRNPVWRYGA